MWFLGAALNANVEETDSKNTEVVREKNRNISVVYLLLAMHERLYRLEPVCYFFNPRFGQKLSKNRAKCEVKKIANRFLDKPAR
jgi:hypothetical protein